MTGISPTHRLAATGLPFAAGSPDFETMTSAFWACPTGAGIGRTSSCPAAESDFAVSKQRSMPHADAYRVRRRARVSFSRTCRAPSESHAEPLSVTAPAIEARELYRFYHIGDDETQALRGVSLAVQPGEIVAVVGPSGSGKSTLIACLAGLDEPDGGFVYVNGDRLSRRDEKARTSMRAQKIGILLQSGKLLRPPNGDGNVSP